MIAVAIPSFRQDTFQNNFGYPALYSNQPHRILLAYQHHLGYLGTHACTGS
jgi:hypothetical protein